MTTGVVKWFEEKKGYGFITGDDGEDYFIHYSNIKQEGFKNLKQGDKVRFNVSGAAKGKEAKDVEVV